MGLRSLPLSPASLQDFYQQEIPFRQSIFSDDVARRVMRYGAVVGSRIHHFDRLDRCMDQARKLILDHEHDGRSFFSGTVILADRLENSMGRFGRFWHAPDGGLWLVLILVNTLIPALSRLIPLAAGVACCEMIRLYDIDARIKWVNDILVNGRKMAGILTETCVGRNSGEEYILIGMGVNVNNADFPSALQDVAGSMGTVLGRQLDLNRARHELLAKLAWNIGLLYEDEGRCLQTVNSAEKAPDSLLLSSWRALSDTIGRQVRFGFNVVEEPHYEAGVIGLNADGGLVLALADGSRVVEHGGEIVYLDRQVS